MTLPAPTNAPPLSLSGILRAIVYLFRQSGDATPILVGDEYLSGRGVGSDARIVIVPTVGSIAAAQHMGDAAAISYACEVHVRGAESGDDIGRFDAADALAIAAISAIRRTCVGRLGFEQYAPTSPTKVDAFGAQVSFTFVWTRDVRKHVGIYSVPTPTPEAFAQFFTDAPAAIPTNVAIVATNVPTE